MSEANTVIGLDVGYGRVKAVCADGRAVDEPALTLRVGGDDFGIAEDVRVIDDLNGRYVAGEAAQHYGRAKVPRVDSGWIDTPEYRVLAFHALEQLGYRRADVVAGLPLDLVRSHSARLKSVMHDWRKLGVELNVLRVLPQPLGTLWDVATTVDGSFRADYANQRIGVIDVGSGTIDCLEISDFKPSMTMWKTLDHGISRAYDFAYYRIAEKHGPDAVSRAEMPAILRERTMHKYGKQVDVSKVAKDALRPVLFAIAEARKELWGSGAGLSKIIVTGGGAEMLRDMLPEVIHRDQVVVPDEPSLSNARGFCKLATAIGEAA